MKAMFILNPELPKKCIGNVPSELWLLVFGKLSIHTLLETRKVSCKFNSIAMRILSNLLQEPMVKSIKALRESQLDLVETVREKEPLLRHYKEFLSPATSNESLSEVIWFSVAPTEVRSVCECLVRLFQNVEEQSSQRISWPRIRKIMKQSNFKVWLNNISTNVDAISSDCTKAVEQIIRVDPLITYERLRDVSTAGFRLLIVIAAVLQYTSITAKFAAKRNTTNVLKESVERRATFMDLITHKLDK